MNETTLKMITMETFKNIPYPDAIAPHILEWFQETFPNGATWQSLHKAFDDAFPRNSRFLIWLIAEILSSMRLPAIQYGLWVTNLAFQHTGVDFKYEMNYYSIKHAKHAAHRLEMDDSDFANSANGRNAYCVADACESLIDCWFDTGSNYGHSPYTVIVLADEAIAGAMMGTAGSTQLNDAQMGKLKNARREMLTKAATLAGYILE